jgi:hypothetical protein
MGDHEELGAKEISAIVLKENHVESKLRTVTMDSLRGQFLSVKLAKNSLHLLSCILVSFWKCLLPENQDSVVVKKLL